MAAPGPASGVARRAIRVRGAVQGVGFRPFACRTGADLGLAGFVRNGPDGVELEVEGPDGALDGFVEALRGVPPPARIDALEAHPVDARGERGFRIVASERASSDYGERASIEHDEPSDLPLPPDLATCDACMAEVLDPTDRRHRHPFASCARCGPRYSALAALPWDRARTSMAGFPPCAGCRAEYEDPADRRFHAQTLCCPDCGPRLEALDPAGRSLARDEDALQHALGILRRGGIVAVLGLGGFQLMVDARDEAAVRRLRKRKQRPAKPLALLVRDADAAGRLVELDAVELGAFESAAAPIVLARERAGVAEPVAPSVAPGVAWLGVMRPTTPLHRLLVDGAGGPLVATSGNLSGEPLCATLAEARSALGAVADAFLVHDRPVVRPIDDSVVRAIAGRIVTLRAGRGLAPQSFAVPRSIPPRAALGGDLKAAVAVGRGHRILLGPHVGDLETLRARDFAARDLAALARLGGVHGATIAADAHPDGHAGRLARELDPSARGVRHHHAHVLSCVAEHGLALPILGVAWDGNGAGDDGTVWGGELLRVDANGYERLAHLQRFRLPGGEQAIREPRRAALGALFARFGPALLERGDPPLRHLTPAECRALVTLLERGRFAPETSSAGRLFDVAASLLGLCQVNRYEGQAALELESCARSDPESRAYPMALRGGVLDWGPLLDALLADRDAGVPRGVVATRFHRGLACGIVSVVRQASQATGIARVVLTGGCFQNALLSELALAGLAAAGLEAWGHERVPPGDGGLALGQLLAIANPSEDA